MGFEPPLPTVITSGFRMTEFIPFDNAKTTVAIIISTIVNMGRLPITSPRIIISTNPPLAMLQSSFTRLPVIGFGANRGLGSVGIAFSESLYERQVVPRYPTLF